MLGKSLFSGAGPSIAVSATWQQLKVGGGGFTRDIDIANDGTKVCKVDVYGMYVYNASSPNPGNAGGTGVWQLLTKPGPIQAGDPAFTLGSILGQGTASNWYGSQGGWDIRVAPSNGSVIYMIWCGMMYKSSDRGVTFTNQTNNAGGTFPRLSVANSQTNAGGTGQQNGTGPPMAIDPINPNVCWVGTLAGVYNTVNGGSTWTTVSSSILPIPATSGYSWTGFAFDPQSATTSGVTQGIYSYINGSGVYYTSNAGSSWTLLSGSGFTGTMPTLCIRLVVDKFGVAWVAQDNQHPSAISSNLHNFTVHAGTAFTANTWTTSSTTTPFVWGIAPDPASISSATQRLIITDWAGNIAQSTNGGSSWTPKQQYTGNLVATDIPWLATNEAADLSLDGNIKFDPSQSNALYYPEGIGVWYANLPTVGSSASWGTWNWISQTAGIESLETTQIINPPGGNIGLAQWDRNWFVLNNATAPYPSTYGTTSNQPTIVAGQSIDWAGSNPNFVAIHSAGTYDAYSNSGGSPAITSWQPYTTQPPGPGDPNGAAGMAVSTDSSIMVVANGLFATTSRGASTWTTVTPAGSSGWGNGGAQISIPLAADRVTANYYVGYPGGTSVYYTANAGSSWTTVNPGFSSGSSNNSGIQLKSIPNNAGHYFICFGGSFGTAPDTTNHFYRTINGGSTWTDVSQSGYTVRDVYVWGFGAAQSGNTYPTIFIYGFVNSVMGVWQSIDNCVSWQKIGDQQIGGSTFDTPNAMNGDMNVPGQLYVGMFGSGYVWYGVN